MKKTTASSKKTANYVTEAYLDGKISVLEQKLDGKISVLEQKLDGKLSVLKQELKEEIVEEIDEKNEKYKDEVMTKLDDISGQLENLQEDKVLSIHQTEELRGKVDNHEERLKNLEKVQTSP